MASKAHPAMANKLFAKVLRMTPPSSGSIAVQPARARLLRRQLRRYFCGCRYRVSRRHRYPGMKNGRCRMQGGKAARKPRNAGDTRAATEPVAVKRDPARLHINLRYDTLLASRAGNRSCDPIRQRIQ